MKNDLEKNHQNQMKNESFSTILLYEIKFFLHIDLFKLNKGASLAQHEMAAAGWHVNGEQMNLCEKWTWMC